jgi:hypothetical protein
MFAGVIHEETPNGVCRNGKKMGTIGVGHRHTTQQTQKCFVDDFGGLQRVPVHFPTHGRFGEAMQIVNHQLDEPIGRAGNLITQVHQRGRDLT